MSVIYEDRPPVFDYLLAARLIEEVHPYPDSPHLTYWVLTDTGKEELRLINNRAKRHIMLVAFCIICFTPFSVMIYRAINRFVDLPFIPDFENICSCIASIGGFFGIGPMIEEYHDDCGVWSKRRVHLFTCMCVVLIISLCLAFYNF